MRSSLNSAADFPEICRTASSTPRSKSIRVPTTSKVRTLKLLNDMVPTSLLFVTKRTFFRRRSLRRFRYDDGILGMEADAQALADRRDAPARLVVARLAEAQSRAVVKRDEHPQALALIDNLGDAAGELVAVACVAA